MTDLRFTKMHGAGNDFIIIDNRQNVFSDKEIIALAPRICHRRFGVGADGIMALQSTDNPSLDYTMFYRNADGSDAGMCGNGARCLALFATKLGLGTQLTFNVHETVYEAELNPEKNYATIYFPMQVDIKELSMEGYEKIYQLYAGTEHIVIEISKSVFKNDNQLRQEGQLLRYHTEFNPPGTNVNFITAESSNKIRIKTYERGVENLTLACGTGAIAAALAWHHIQENGQPSGQIIVEAEGGTLNVSFNYNSENDIYSDINLSGGAQFVYEGIYAL